MSVPRTERDPIAEAIPHRDPFLFVTRIVERDEHRIVTEWRVPPDADFFRGHYPGRPLVPGVLICESAFQAGAILCSSEELAIHGAMPVLTRIGDARFKRMVAPGETLRCEVALEHKIGAARYMKAKITCGDELVLRVEFVVAVTNASSGPAA